MGFIVFCLLARSACDAECFRRLETMASTIFLLSGYNSFRDRKLEAAIHTRVITKATLLVPDPGAGEQPRAREQKEVGVAIQTQESKKENKTKKKTRL